jgi:hypothetical protein
MSVGNPIIRVRVATSMLKRINADLERKNRLPCYGAMDISQWLRDAIREKLEHGERSRRCVGKRSKPSMHSDSSDNAPIDSASLDN